MKLAALPVDMASDEKLESVEEAGEEAMETECVPLVHGETIVPGTDKCYLLTFDTDRWETTFPIDASNSAAIAFFAQHLLTEFEEDTHYLKLVSSGEDIDPVAEESGAHGEEEEEKKSKPWGKAIGASILINLVTLSGLIFAVPFISRIIKKSDPVFVYAGFASFAAGAILACAFFLLLFESTHLIATGWDEETDHIWRWGTMILFGLILPVIVEAFVGHIKPEDPDADKKTKSDVETDSEDFSDDESPFAAKTFSEKARLVFAICFGDFMHNLCDGFFVGAAFAGCSDSMAWGIAIATILHEIPQELSDYLILTGPQVGLSTLTALAINFATGLSVILGAIIVLAADVSDSATGLLLAFGGGVYLQIGCVECMPKMVNPALSPRRKLVCLLAFIVGAVLIGLVLLDHEHCIAEGDGHDDHGH
eukprot:CAMPEP_0197234068 /NCGR_PEP_ID=MMETSP1429-20130617/1913_1 /TAXON_ID=49237 /ORGANISM="Chaetoceros  sp., Strain UNC1202" /LENGTH=422 /DNA_ID=CAMNT_0042692395 /DNA_START=27 /DNA_END=1295 /DNA_ORIENTATION=-